MAIADWRMQGVEFIACNCNWGCPCQFDAPPTHGHCQAVASMRVDHGYFNQVTLEGLCWAATFAWPGASPSCSVSGRKHSTLPTASSGPRSCRG